MRVCCCFIVLALLVASEISKASKVKVVILRGSASQEEEDEEEEGGESLSEDESKEINWLLDLIDKESSEPKPPTVKTVRVKQRTPNNEPIAEDSDRRERVLAKDKENLEYHVHYHNHKHLTDLKESHIAEDQLYPVIWDSTTPLANFKDFESILRTPMLKTAVPYMESGRFENFRDFETVVDTESKFHAPPNDNLNNGRFANFKDFETLVDNASKPPAPKNEQRGTDNPYEKFKEFKEFLEASPKVRSPHSDRISNSQFEEFKALVEKTLKLRSPESGDSGDRGRVQIFKDFETLSVSKPRAPHNGHSGNSGRFEKNRKPHSGYSGNGGRFENFKDFETLSDPASKPPTHHSGRHDGAKGFNIVIKVPQKSQSPYNVHFVRGGEQKYKELENILKTASKSATPSSGYKGRDERLRSFGTHINDTPKPKPNGVGFERAPYHEFHGPRILDFPGGAPKYIEKLNQLNFDKEHEGRNLGLKSSFHHNVNSVHNPHVRNYFRLRPLPSNRFIHNVPHQRPLNGWLIRRLM